MDFNLLVLTSFEVTTKDSQEPNYTWTLDYTHNEDAETVFIAFYIQCSKHYQVYVAILIHKVSC